MLRKLTVERLSRKDGGTQMRLGSLWNKGLVLVTSASKAKMDLLGVQRGGVQVSFGSLWIIGFRSGTTVQQCQRSTQKEEGGAAQGVRRHAGVRAV